MLCRRSRSTVLRGRGAQGPCALWQEYSVAAFVDRHACLCDRALVDGNVEIFAGVDRVVCPELVGLFQYWDLVTSIQ